ncbi:MAG: hypothetical protein VB027_05925 [Gordonibacter sp.]|nr:hypothetical protein [Gordonibacter sp.]
MSEHNFCLSKYSVCFGKKNEVGTVAPLIVVSALLLLTVLAFAIDQGVACAIKVRQENALDAARDACMAPSFALVAKNSDDPGRMVAVKLVQVLHEADVKGKITVWFYEVPVEDLSDSRRVWGIGVQAQENSPTTFAQSLGITSLPVASNRVIVAEPFSSEVTWRPNFDGGNGCYELDTGKPGEDLAFSHFSELEEFPDEVKEVVRAAVLTAGYEQERKERI